MIKKFTTYRMINMICI